MAELDGELVGVGRYERTSPDSAEVAFVVADGHQGQGLGAAFLRRLAEHARACGLRWLTASTMAYNRPMLAVFKHSGLSVETQFDEGVIDVTMALD